MQWQRSIAKRVPGNAQLREVRRNWNDPRKRDLKESEMPLDVVLLTNSPSVRDGLNKMLTAAVGEHGYTLEWEELPIALLLIEIAKRANDREDWFPHGRWATIQHMQHIVDEEMRKLFRTPGDLDAHN
jgi:hypothetical protein